MPENFGELLAGGHPNSLGRTIEVVDLVLAAPACFDELFACYKSSDYVVRLRTSNAMKRVAKQRPDLLVPYLDRFLSEVGSLEQASAQWTLAQLLDIVASDLSKGQKDKAIVLLKRNLEQHDDWIVLNHTIETLAKWSKDDAALCIWLKPNLERLSKDHRKSVAKRASKWLAFFA